MLRCASLENNIEKCFFVVFDIFYIKKGNCIVKFHKNIFNLAKMLVFPKIFHYNGICVNESLIITNEVSKE